MRKRSPMLPMIAALLVSAAPCALFGQDDAAGSQPLMPEELEGLGPLNRRRLDDDGAWMQVLPYDGRHLVVGPLFLPDASACRACYLARRGACSGYEEDFARIEAAPVRASAPPSLAAAAAAIAAVVALRWSTIRDATLPGRLYALDPGPVLRLSHHRVLRVPRCPECGPTRAVPSPWHQAAWA